MQYGVSITIGRTLDPDNETLSAIYEAACAAQKPDETSFGHATTERQAIVTFQLSDQSGERAHHPDPKPGATSTKSLEKGYLALFNEKNAADLFRKTAQDIVEDKTWERHIRVRSHTFTKDRAP